MVTCIFLRAYHSGHCYNRDKNAFNKVIKQLIRRTTIGRLGWKCMWSAARALCYLLVRMPVTCATACGREKRALTGRRAEILDRSTCGAPPSPLVPPDAVTLFHLLAVRTFNAVEAMPTRSLAA